jgi:CDP-diacylglycerol--serine O-phosphatidyltransferase
MCIVSYLETSRIPTISLKKTKINASMIIPLLIIVALMANFLFTQTWLTLGVLTALYTLSIPLGVLKFLKDKRDFQKAQAVSEQI